MIQRAVTEDLLPPETDLKSAPLMEHLEELRSRIIYAAIFLALGFMVAFAYRAEILDLLKEPLTYSQAYKLGKVQLVSNRMTSQFMAVLNLSFWAGLALSLPFLLGQVWGFIAPGLYPHERRWALPFVIGAGLSFLGGAVFGYLLVLPTMVPFLVDFSGGQVAPFLDVQEYIGFIVTFLVAFGLSFEMPIVAVILTRIGLVNHTLLRQGWRIALVAIMIAAAVITPTPDPWNMLLVALPLYALYELSIVLSRVFRLADLSELPTPEL